ncbi:HNH endonuclease signature motif containing protein, partial [Geodermatophilus sp. CPCC 205761]|uniref:HNH endonuclease signature motif containing protein n=1 Tax=Geodermatophilus sp. CPCC 205761 TaxID=2936597 RepID=UPI003EF03B16
NVTVRPVGDGMSELVAKLPHALASACRQAVDGLARAARSAGDQRPVGVLRVGALADLLLRPWATDREPVTAQLTITAPLDALTPQRFLDSGARLPAVFAPPGSIPAPVGEVDGQPITAAHLRELLTQLDAVCPGGLQAPAGGTLNIAITDAGGALRATTTRRELERIARHGCPTHGHTGCRCPVLDRPPPVDRYTPSDAQRRWLETRDRTCRHPGCANAAGWADLDHVIPHARGGATSCANLCCLCRRHHRLKTHAPGWSYAITPDGVLSVTTPSGVTRTTRPPGHRPEPNLSLTGSRVLAAAPPEPPPAPDPADDPPPF